LNVRADGELAKTTEKFTLSKRQAPALEMRAGSHSTVHLRGWDRRDYDVEVCKFAAASTRLDAERLLHSVTLRRDGARVTTAGPDDERDWQTVFFVHAPADAVLNLESGNAPVDAVRVNGKVSIHSANGPLSFDQCAGRIEAETTNGPISLNGGSGEVHLRSGNGPISLRLSDPVWHGSVLEASTGNGPLSAKLPSGFRSGLRVETSGHAPISCQAEACWNARTEGARFFPRRLQAGSGDVVRLFTHNGPVSITGPGRHPRII
jgi:hypothetical protein